MRLFHLNFTSKRITASQAKGMHCARENAIEVTSLLLMNQLFLDEFAWLIAKTVAPETIQSLLSTHIRI